MDIKGKDKKKNTKKNLFEEGDANKNKLPKKEKRSKKPSIFDDFDEDDDFDLNNQDSVSGFDFDDDQL